MIDPMKQMITVTTGQNYTDIDAAACVLGLQNLYELKGFKSRSIMPGVLNATVTKELLPFIKNYSQKYNPVKNEVFSIVDVSEKEYFAEFVVE